MKIRRESNLIKAVKTAAHANQSKLGLGTRSIPNKKKRVEKFRFTEN